jgi:hypothetical protein
MRLRVFAPLLAILLGCSASAHAVSLSLQGRGAGIENSATQALYASDSSGASVIVTAVGSRSPIGGTITELGVPSMMPDGRVLFGAETTPPTGPAHWDIFAGMPDAPPDRRIVRAVELTKVPNDCQAKISGDPYPVGDADGEIAFMARLPLKFDALVLSSGGKIVCLAKSGANTNQGHEIAVLSFGSPEMGSTGEVAFNAWLAVPAAKGDKPEHVGHRQAVLLASPTGGVTELAVEDEYGPNHTRYERPFGLPSALPTSDGTLVAFTAKTPTGAALFLYNGGTMSRILPTGILTPVGPVSYLSPGRPGLMADGTTAVMAGCARIPVIFRLTHQRLDIPLQRGQLTPFGTEIESLGDPVLTAAGAMFVGATDTDGREKLFVLDGDNAFFEVGQPELIYKIAYSEHHHSIFTGTLTVNQHGDFAYLGGK